MAARASPKESVADEFGMACYMKKCLDWLGKWGLQTPKKKQLLIINWRIMENPTWGLMNQGNSAHSPSFKHIPKGNLYEVLDAFISGISTTGRSENIWRYGWMRVLKTWELLIPQN